MHPLQLTAFPTYQPGGWLGKHFKQAGVSHAQALPSKFPLTAFQKRAPNPSGLAAAAPHLAAGGERLAGLVTDWLQPQQLALVFTLPSAPYSLLRNLSLGVIFCLIRFSSRERKKVWEGEKGVGEKPFGCQTKARHLDITLDCRG